MRFPKLLWVFVFLWSPSPAAGPLDNASVTMTIAHNPGSQIPLPGSLSREQPGTQQRVGTSRDHESPKSRGKIAFSITAGEPRVVGRVGLDAHFNCCISVEISTKDMEVRWYTSNMSSPVHRYHNGSDDDSQQDPRYQGRTELLHDHVHVGCVRLTLRDVRPSDEGNYTCYFESAHANHLARSTTTLEVADVGSDPVIEIKETKDGGKTLVCKSSGWYPEPEVWWEPGDGESWLTTNISREESSLFTVITQVHIPKHRTCHVTNTRLNETKTANLPDPECSCWIAILLTGIIVVLLLLLLIFWMLKRCNLRGFFWCVPGQTGASAHIPDLKLDEGFKEKLLDVQGQGDPVEIQNLENQIETLKMKCHSFTAPSRVDFTLVPWTTSHQLELSENRKQVKFRPLDPAPVSELAFQATCAVGCLAFTEGKHCWEVEVGRACSWALGAAVESVSPDGPPAPNPEHGIWAVGRAAGQSEGHYQAFTSPLTELRLDPPPEKVLVYLDREAGQLSFYYADTRLPIYTFMCRFKVKVVAFIWTRDRDSWITVCPAID